jgi:hypothetical protein
MIIKKIKVKDDLIKLENKDEEKEEGKEEKEVKEEEVDKQDENANLCKNCCLPTKIKCESCLKYFYNITKFDCGCTKCSECSENSTTCEGCENTFCSRKLIYNYY